jgi:hypothetical protein
MKLTVGSLLSMTNYLAELAEIRAVLRAMIVTTMSTDHRQRLRYSGPWKVQRKVAANDIAFVEDSRHSP